MVEYVYDTWGKKASTTGSLAGTLGLFQPFRYRGYVYDWETGFYYLQSRYYDPTTDRFISADILLSTGQGVLGHNCYAYCLDNPASLADYTGFDPVLVIGGVAISLETIIIVCALIVLLGYYVLRKLRLRSFSGGHLRNIGIFCANKTVTSICSSAPPGVYSSEVFCCVQKRQNPFMKKGVTGTVLLTTHLPPRLRIASAS